MKIATLALCLACSGASAQTVSLNGSMGSDRALLIIDGKPRAVAVGSTVNGVKLLRLDEGQSQVDVGGNMMLLRIGAAPGRVGEAKGGSVGGRIVLTAGLGGHFETTGSINGRSVQFLVDTGATNVSISQGEADRIGLDYRNAPRGMTATANGAVPIHYVTLSAVRVGDVEVYQVPAVVFPAQLQAVLLGNSFLSRFQMKRENDILVLEKRP
ncbi:MAG TPA: retropepsin-like aspartic protease [Burkholderiaceae bacterium]|nr:retropepsin-like aspartic protease [Burkholderiaceae bacterium]